MITDNYSNEKLLARYELIGRNKNLTERTIEAQGYDLRLFDREVGKPFEEVSHIDVEDFLFYCQSERKNKDAALNRKFASLNKFFQTMIKKDYLVMPNPMDKLEPIKVRKKIRDHLDEEEFKQLVDYLRSGERKRDLAIVMLFYASGCRLSELWQQDRVNIDFNKRQFKVKGKGDKERLCILSKEAAEILSDYLKSRDDDIPALFISRYGNKLSRKAIQDMVKKAGKNAGLIKNVHPHIFRHTRAMHLLRNRVPLETIQRLLGHENISTTQVYAHSNLEDLQSDIDSIDELAA